MEQKHVDGAGQSDESPYVVPTVHDHGKVVQLTQSGGGDCCEDLNIVWGSHLQPGRKAPTK
jgi:hypothetical protein